MTPTPRRFLSEALPLVSSYFSGESVSLGALSADAGEAIDQDGFAKEIGFRHALACAAEVSPVILRLEVGISTINRTVRAETKGVVRGHLDVPRYVMRRASTISWPRTYPILVATEDASTPENALAARMMRSLLARLQRRVPAGSAEAMAAQRYRQWLMQRLRRAPWNGVFSASSIKRLRLEAGRRVARRQTGNDVGYRGLVTFVDEWWAAGADFGSAESSARVANALLAFPADEAFEDKIYEIWCLMQVANSLVRLGGTVKDGPTPLYACRTRPAYRIKLASHDIEVWFQRPLDGRYARWRYKDNEQSLRGIPDITVVANGKRSLLLDAKNRFVISTSRSEETYKVLGYFENYREVLGVACRAILAFVSTGGFGRELESIEGGRVVLVSADPSSPAECSFSSQIDNALRDWLSS